MLKDILVHVDGSEPGERRLKAAVALAARHDAHLTAQFVTDVFFPFYPVDPSLAYLDGGGMQRLLDELSSEARADAERIRTKFQSLCVSSGVSGEWRSVEGPTAEMVLSEAMTADLCILGQTDPKATTWPSGGSPIERVLFGSGRPVLLIPFHGNYEMIGSEALIGWKPTRETVRAVNDALPLLRRANQTTVLAINPADEKPADARKAMVDVAAHLSRHDVGHVCELARCGRGEEANTLLNYASDRGANLMVIGGYGHSRARETILGGVTRTILRTMTIPVLFSH